MNKPKYEFGSRPKEYVLGNYGYQEIYTVLDEYGSPYDKAMWEQYYILQIGLGESFERYVITDGYFNIASFDTKEELLADLEGQDVRWTVNIDDE